MPNRYLIPIDTKAIKAMKLKCIYYETAAMARRDKQSRINANYRECYSFQYFVAKL